MQIKSLQNKNLFSKKDSRPLCNKKYQSIQKKAADTIEGPVLSKTNHSNLIDYCTFEKYLVLLPQPFITKTSCSSKYCKSLVAVAFEILVIEAYFVAFIPPSKPSGPASNIFCITFNWRSFKPFLC